MKKFDVVIVGGGAAGMMCALEAGRRGRSVLLIEHSTAFGEKIRISGGGRCNFTNTGCSFKNFLSNNKHYCKSALSQYTQHDFISLVKSYDIDFHEKTLGQLFCDGSSTQIIEMLVAEMRKGDVELALKTKVETIEKIENGFSLSLKHSKTDEPLEDVSCSSLVIATGGRSIPKMGAAGFGYKVAEQFGLDLVEQRPALVPLTFDEQLLARLSPLAGIGLDAVVSHKKTRFSEAMLFTHRGLSGPSILQISSYWREGEAIQLDMLPGRDVFQLLKDARQENGRRELQTVLSDYFPKRVADMITEQFEFEGNIADLSDKKLKLVSDLINHWTVQPVGSEGYRTAEVTLGGVDTNGLHSKTMMAQQVPGLYFIGEVVDVTGWLGGYNFQWAWSSGWVAGQNV
ncbi:MAG: NAD(P)/FAD-dependent oxidoreductase [Rhizobiales bacterium]|nr:NAD(P)/FAD-dependent oxidoreductase [Hyphomicrobiales bacterium]